MGAEEEVREAWERAVAWSRDGKLHCISLGGMAFTVVTMPDTASGYADSEDEAWTAAAEFTRLHRQKIAEVQEEIEVLKSLSVPLFYISALLRCGKRAEEALADLMRGWKGKP